MDLDKVQNEVWTWKCINFPQSSAVEQFLGVVEEVGEASHAILKKSQGIRGSEEKHQEDLRDAIGDIMIYLLNFCSANGWSLSQVIEETWDVVKRRDWVKNTEDGVNG